MSAEIGAALRRRSLPRRRGRPVPLAVDPTGGRDARIRGPMAAAAAVVVGTVALLTACGEAAEAPIEQAAAATAPAAERQPAAATVVPATPQQAAIVARIDATAADALSFGLPLYPGAAVDGDAGSRIVLPAGTTVMVTLRSADPASQVAAFYREALWARAAGVEYADMGDAAGVGGTALVLADPGAGLAVQVQVSPAGSGSVVQIIDTRAVR